MTMEDAGIKNLPFDEKFKRFLIDSWGIASLYPPQMQAMKPILNGKNTLVSIPTASGKSLLAYTAIVQSLQKYKPAKAIYIVPLKALASEKYEELMEIGQALGLHIGLAIGDATSETKNIDKADVLVCTSEKLDSLIRHRSELFEQLRCIVADEFHLMNDASRGPTLEMNLTRLRLHHPQAQIIALSATVGNVQELADWLDAELILSEWRPVDLEYSTFHNFHVEPRKIQGHGSSKVKLSPPRTLPGLVSHPVWSVVDDAMNEASQVLLFVGTRKSAQAEARNLSKRVLKRLKCEDVDRISRLSELANQIANSSNQSSISDHLAESIRGGVAFHHAGLTHQQRKVVEHAFKEGLLIALTATPTLAAGVNLPARRVLIRDLKRWDDGFNRPLPIMEVRQMMGRAGRPKYDTKGEAWIYCKNSDGWEEADAVSQRYFFGQVENISSKLASEPALRMHLLALIATGGYCHKGKILHFFKNTFLGKTLPPSQLEERITQMLNWLVEERFLRNLGPDEQYEPEEHPHQDGDEPWDDSIPSWVTAAKETEGVEFQKPNSQPHTSAHSVPTFGFQSANQLHQHPSIETHHNDGGNIQYEGTELGIRISQLYIDPLSATILRTGLRRFVRRAVRQDGPISTLGMLHLVCSTPDFPSLWAKSKDLEPNSQMFLKMNSSEDEFVLEQTYLEDMIAKIKSAWMLEQWCEEDSFRTLETTFDVAPGDVHQRTTIAEWLLYCAKEILLLDDVFSHEHSAYIADIAQRFGLTKQRIRHGCKEDLLQLVNIRNIGRNRARELALMGLRTPKDVYSMGAKQRMELESKRGWGPVLIESIMTEIKKVLRTQSKKSTKRLDDTPLEGERSD
ncbi:MAG: DEAD/DEAH box helicase [Candidatus Poseidoniales archaeon]